jgi:hypothetical protein
LRCASLYRLDTRRQTPQGGSVLSHQDGFARGWELAAESISARLPLEAPRHEFGQIAPWMGQRRRGRLRPRSRKATRSRASESPWEGELRMSRTSANAGT